MNVKTHSLAVVSAVAVSVASIATASAGVIVPADFAQGTLTAVDTVKNTVSIDGTTYGIANPAAIETSLGGDVTVTYMMVDGKLRALWVEPTVNPDDATADAE